LLKGGKPHFEEKLFIFLVARIITTFLSFSQNHCKKIASMLPDITCHISLLHSQRIGALNLIFFIANVIHLFYIEDSEDEPNKKINNQ
jgi:hypothetical protein